jgi:choloylglycine hydrolase
MTYNGSFDAIMEGQHRQILNLYKAFPEGIERKRGCSMYRYGVGSGGMVGRNFDNVFSELLVAYYYPSDGYASLGFVPLTEIGFNDDNRFDAENPSHRRALFIGPAVTIEGINEKGVTVTLASLDKQKVRQDPDRKPRFLIHLVREILDHAASLDEAIAIAGKYNVFDNGREIISHHIFVADPGGSAVLEWRDGEMEVVRDQGDWQVVTNSPLFEVGDKRRRKACPRYGSLARTLSGAGDTFTWSQGMDTLTKTVQRNRHYNLDGENLRISTQWSTVFDLEQLTAYVCLGGDFAKVYKLDFPVPPGRE